MTLKDRENRMYELEEAIDELYKTEVWLDYRDIIIDMQSFLEEMIENPNNEYKPQKDEWTDLYDELDELMTCIEDASIQFKFKKNSNYRNYYASTRKKILKEIKKEFSLLDDKVKTISNGIEDLIDCCQIVSDNSDKPGFLEEHKNNADKMIQNLEFYEERLIPYKAIVKILIEL